MMSPELRPLSVFAAQDLGTTPNAGDYIQSISGQIGPKNRQSLADYLRSGQMVLSWMEQTIDVIAGRFSVPGGSAILSDGTFFWRLDAADYVETYGVQLPEEFIRHVKNDLAKPQDELHWLFTELDNFFGSGRGSFAQLLDSNS